MLLLHRERPGLSVPGRLIVLNNQPRHRDIRSCLVDPEAPFRTILPEFVRRMQWCFPVRPARRILGMIGKRRTIEGLASAVGKSTAAFDASQALSLGKY